MTTFIERLKRALGIGSGEIDSAVLRTLHPMFRGLSRAEEAELDRAGKLIAEIRSWAETQDDARVRAAYRRWLDFFEREVARHREDNKRERRVNEVMKAIPRPPTLGGGVR